MERGCARGEGNIGTGTTKLFTHNIDVDIINDKYLSLISGAEKKYEMTSRGSRSLIENLKKSCLSPETLRLKVGAKVKNTNEIKKTHPAHPLPPTPYTSTQAQTKRG
jgi:hypothetical protein